MPYIRGRTKAVFSTVVAVWLAVSVVGGAAAQSRLPGNIGDPVDFEDTYSDKKDSYLGGLKELLRHDPNLSEIERPLSLRDLDKDEAPPLIIASGQRAESRTNTAGSRPDDSSQYPSAARDLVTSYFGAAGLVDDADSLLIFRRADAPKAPVRYQPDGRTLDGFNSVRRSIYEFGLISPTAPTFGEASAPSHSRSLGRLKIADLGIANPALQVRLAIPNFGGNLAGSGRAIGTQRGSFGVSASIGSGHDQSQKRSIVAWVKATVSQAATQPLFYVVVVGVLMILGLLGARRRG